jgi:hypothetical protein
MAQVRRPTEPEVRDGRNEARSEGGGGGLVAAWGGWGPRNLGVRRALGLGSAGGRVAERGHGPGELLEGRVHPLEAVAEGEQIRGNGAQVVALEKRVDVGGVEGSGRGVR